jgi:hypothetical protein
MMAGVWLCAEPASSRLIKATILCLITSIDGPAALGVDAKCLPVAFPLQSIYDEA